MSEQFLLADFPANPLEKAEYLLEFSEEFDKGVLDESKWIPHYLAHWSSRAVSKPNYEFENNNLILEIQENQKPWCPEFDGTVVTSTIQTGAFAGELGSKIGQHRFNKASVVREEQENLQLYTPQYGYFEIRAKANINKRNLLALWMMGYEDSPEKSGEIVVFEIFGHQTKATETQVCYGVHPWEDSELAEEFYRDLFPIAATDYHIYAVEWKPSGIDFYLDNQKIRSIQQSPNYPLQFMLSIYELPENEANAEKHLPENYPKKFIVDYIRGYRPIAGY